MDDWNDPAWSSTKCTKAEKARKVLMKRIRRINQIIRFRRRMRTMKERFVGVCHKCGGIVNQNTIKDHKCPEVTER